MRQRLAKLPRLAEDTSPEIAIANSWRARLLGLAGRNLTPEPGLALLLPGTGSVHTFAMAFPIDLFWLDTRSEVLRIDRAVKPRRIRFCGGATAVIEVPTSARQDRIALGRVLLRAATNGRSQYRQGGTS